MRSCSRRLALLLCLWIPGALAPLAAQQPAIRTLSLDEAIDRAVGGAEEVAIARAGVLRAEGNQDIAASAFLPQVNASQIRFREGIATQIDLSDARLLLEQAIANCARAQRNVEVARVRLALLRDLPLSTGGGSVAAAAAAMGAGATTGGAVTGAQTQPGAPSMGGAQNFQGTTGP